MRSKQLSDSQRETRRIFFLLICLLLGLFLGGCNPEEPDSSGVAGHYTLRSIAGHPLPVSSNLGSYKAGSIQLNQDSTFIDVIIIGNVVDSIFGQYKLRGDSVKMTPQDWTPYTLHWNGSRILTIIWGEGEFLYRKN